MSIVKQPIVVIDGTKCPACDVPEPEMQNIECQCGGVGFLQHIEGCPGANQLALYKCMACDAEMHLADILWQADVTGKEV